MKIVVEAFCFAICKSGGGNEHKKKNNNKLFVKKVLAE